MNKSVIKAAYSKIHASDEFKYKTVLMLEGKKRKRFSNRMRPFSLVAASLIIILGFAAIYRFPKKQYKASNSNSDSTRRYVMVPKIELPKKSNAQADMIGLIVYKGRIYIQSGTSISIENADKIIGDKLGTAKGNIDEWSEQKDFATEFASTIFGDVYSVKGYDTDFRIMTFIKYTDGSKWACFYENLNGIRLFSGQDVFDKLKIKDNVSNVTYVQWYDFKTPIYTINDEKLTNKFIDALSSSIPYLYEQIPEKLFDSQNSEDYRIIRIMLKDGCDITFILRKGGYVSYRSCMGTAFKMNDKIFNELWDKLDYSKDTSIKK